jgi:cAMP-dependent protein kinase regulator
MLIVLDVHAFERLLGPCMDIMKRNFNHYEDQLVKIFGSKSNVTDLRWLSCWVQLKFAESLSK